MQQQSSFYNSSQHLPQTPDSAGILIATAGSAANERRGQKTIMNCFRDRTPSYTRSTSNITRGNAIIQKNPNSKLEGVVLLKEPRPRPIKLTLLKSSSTRDLTRLLELDSAPVTPLSSQSSLDINKMTSSSSSSSATNCTNSCLRYIQKLEQRIEDLENRLETQATESKTMSTQLEELNKKFEKFLKDTDLQNKRKKSSSIRLTKKESITAINQTGDVQPSKLVAWMKLSNFWKQRPSIQTLKDQNIYNGK